MRSAISAEERAASIASSRRYGFMYLAIQDSNETTSISGVKSILETQSGLQNQISILGRAQNCLSRAAHSKISEANGFQLRRIVNISSIEDDRASHAFL